MSSCVWPELNVQILGRGWVEIGRDGVEGNAEREVILEFVSLELREGGHDFSSLTLAHLVLTASVNAGQGVVFGVPRSRASCL